MLMTISCSRRMLLNTHGECWIRLSNSRSIRLELSANTSKLKWNLKKKKKKKKKEKQWMNDYVIWAIKYKAYKILLKFVSLFGFLTSSSTTRLYRGWVPRLTFDNFTCCHTWDRAGRLWLLSQPVTLYWHRSNQWGAGSPSRDRIQELHDLPTELHPPPPPPKQIISQKVNSFHDMLTI